MQAKTALLTLLLFAALGLGRGYSQFTFHITWDSINVPAPDIQGENDTVRYTLTINNLSNVQFFDSMFFQLRTTVGVFQIASFDSISIPPNGSTVVSFLDSTATIGAKYGGGINIVVVWPTSPSPMVTDSLRDTLTIIKVGVHDPWVGGPVIDVFPVPAEAMVFLRCREPRVEVAATELQNMVGQVIQRFPGLPASIPLSHCPKGMYFIRVEDEHGRTSTFKILKQ